MTDMQTLSFVRAEVQRAEHEGARKVTLNIKDLQELLPHVEAGMSRARTEGAMKHAGWINPMALHGIRSGAENNAKLRRFKTAAFNTEVFFRDSIREKINESIESVKAEELDKRIEIRAQEIYSQWAHLPDYVPWRKRAKFPRQEQARQMAREEIGKAMQEISYDHR